MDTNFLYDFSERQEALREAKAYQTDETKILAEARTVNNAEHYSAYAILEDDIGYCSAEDTTNRIRSLPVKTRFDILVREYPGEFRLCSEDTCDESIVPVEHSHEHECVNHDEENCSWIHPIEIKRSSMMLEDDDSLQANESAGGDYVRDWDDLYLDFPPGKGDEWSKFTYAKSRTVTRQSNPRKVMKEEFTLKETLPNNAYGGVYGAEDGFDYSLSTATAKTSNRFTPRKRHPSKRPVGWMAKLSAEQFAQLMS